MTGSMGLKPLEGVQGAQPSYPRRIRSLWNSSLALPYPAGQIKCSTMKCRTQIRATIFLPAKSLGDQLSGNIDLGLLATKSPGTICPTTKSLAAKCQATNSHGAWQLDPYAATARVRNVKASVERARQSHSKFKDQILAFFHEDL